MTHIEPKKLEDLLEFDKEQFSKMIIAENGDNKAIFFALKKEQVLPEHFSPVDGFVYVVEGEIEFTIYPDPECICDTCECVISDCTEEIYEPETYKVKKGEIFKFYKDEKHSVLAKKDTKMLVVRI